METKSQIRDIYDRHILLFGVPNGKRILVYEKICQELRLIDGGAPEWSWQYLHQVARGKLNASLRFAKAIEIYHAQLIRKEFKMLVPACPVCPSPTVHVHAHGEKAVPVDAPVYNPETQRVIKKSTKPRKKTQRRRDVEVWLF